MINYELTESKSLRYRTTLFEEVLHHLRFCKSKTDTFCGREQLIANVQEKMGVTFTFNDKKNKKISEDETVDMDDDEMFERLQENQEGEVQIKDHLKNAGVKFVLGDSAVDTESDPQFNPKEKLMEIPDMDAYHRPVVVIGKSGSGKTAMMAKLAEMSQSWYRGCVTVIRFMGTSAKSSTIREALTTVCQQLLTAYNVQLPTGIDIEDDYQFLMRYFAALLWQIDTFNKPLVIVFDSIDQLSLADHAHMFNWLPHKLPVNVFMLVSVVTDRTDCVKNVRQVFPFPDQFVEMTDLESNTANGIITSLSRKAHRHLSRKQKNILLDMFAKCGQPLYLRLLMDMSLSWKSFTVVDPQSLATSVTEAINQLFDNLEKSHGQKMVQKGLGRLMLLYWS